MMLTLWYAPGTVALAVHIALEEAAAPYALRKLSFGDGDQNGDAYRQVNPKGRVPTLDTPQGSLTETLAILDWIAGAFPDAQLAPTDPFARARGLSLQTYLASTVHVAHAHKLRGARWSDDPEAWTSMRAKVTENMVEGMAYVADHAFDGPWALGDQYTTTDGYLYTICRWLAGDGVDIADFPILARHFERVEARPAVQRVLEHH